MENPVAKALHESDTLPHVEAFRQDLTKLDIPAAVVEFAKGSVLEDRHLIQYTADATMDAAKKNPVAEAFREPDTASHIEVFRAAVQLHDTPTALAEYTQSEIAVSKHLIHYAAESIESVPAQAFAAVAKAVQRKGR